MKSNKKPTETIHQTRAIHFFLSKDKSLLQHLCTFTVGAIFKRFVIGVDRAKMRLYDCEQQAQEDILDSGQEEEYNYEEKPKKSFEGFKFQ